VEEGVSTGALLLIREILFDLSDIVSFAVNFYNHDGNAWLRNLADSEGSRYRSASHADKRLLVQSLTFVVRQRMPPGRFLRQDEATKEWNDVNVHKDEKTGQWIDVGDAEAWQVVARILQRLEREDGKDQGADRHGDSSNVSAAICSSARSLRLAPSSWSI
jgi:hypothetical protein